MKEKQDDVWCTYCKVDGHFKNQCPTLVQYISIGAPNPIRPGEGVWCEIFKTMGHRPEKLSPIAEVSKTPKELLLQLL